MQKVENISPDPLSADISLKNAFTRVRGHGYGKKAWLAQIIGRQRCNWEFFRGFFGTKQKEISEDDKTGFISFQIYQPGLYEFRNFCIGEKRGKWRWDGFVYLYEEF